MPRPTRTRLAVERLDDRIAPAVGSLDVWFGAGGVVRGNFIPADAALAPGGALVVVGRGSYDSQDGSVTTGYTSVITRLLPDGRPDPAFHGDGRVVIPGGTITSTDHVAVRPDGSILVVAVDRYADGNTAHLYLVSADGGTLTEVATGGDSGVAVNPATGDVYLLDTADDGYPFVNPRVAHVTRLDASFQPIGSVTLDTTAGGEFGTGIALDAAGRVYVVTSGAAGVGVARVDADLDPASAVVATFDVPTFGLAGLAVAPEGGVYVAAGSAIDPTAKVVVLRLGPDLGELARTTVEIVAPALTRPIALDAAGRVVVAGASAPSEEAASDLVVVRLDPVTLAPDATFGTTGRVILDLAARDYPNAVLVDAAGRLLIAGPAFRMPGEAGATVRLLGAPAGLHVGGPVGGAALGLVAANGQYAGATAASPFAAAAAGVRTATADVTGDGIPDLIAGTGPGAVRVTVVDGASGATVAAFEPFEPGFSGGVFVAAGDVDRDGFADVVVSPDAGGGAVVAVYSGAGLAAGRGAAAEFARFLGIDDPNFRGGGRVAVGDVDGDGFADVVVAAGVGGGPRVAVFAGATVVAGGAAPARLMPDFLAFEAELRGGAFVAAGDVTGDGRADLVLGGGTGGAPRVRVLDGAALLAPARPDAGTLTATVADFFAGESAARNGVRVAVSDATGDGRADVVVGSGPGEPSRVRVYRAATAVAGGTPAADQEFDPFGAVAPDGLFVG